MRSPRLPTSAEAGFSVLELVISAVMVSLLVGVLYSFYHSQVVSLRIHRETVNAREEAEIGLDFLLKELRIAGARPAGYDPACTAAPPPATLPDCSAFERLVAATPTSVTFLLDVRGSAASDPSDGCPDDPGERITFSYDATAGAIVRTAIGESGGAPAVLVPDVPAAGFGLVYRDVDGGTIVPGAGGLTAAQRQAVRTIEVRLSTRAARVAPAMAGPVTYPRSASILLRNPAC